MKKDNYIGKTTEYCMLIAPVEFSNILKVLFLLFLVFTISEPEVNGQEKFSSENDVTSFSFDEIPVLVIVEGYKNFYIDAIYDNREQLYVDIEGLLSELGIKCVSGQKGDSLGGFIGSDSKPYLIDFGKKQIVTGTKIINAVNGLVKERGTIYLESSILAEAFGITLTFNFRALTLILKSDFELPVIKLKRIEKLRSNILKIKGEELADTVIKRNYHLFKFGMLDWSVASYQTWNRGTDNRFSLGLGAELLHGEADISVNYYSSQKFDSRQLYYLWRWVDNEKPIIKQAQIGKISNQTISFINAPVIGAVIRNSPTTVRKATGYYTINEITEPNWSVELYINNILVDFTKADASGLFIFKVPIVYGYTTLKLKFYGPLGEERTEERTMNVPYTVMPAHEFEYGLSLGVLEDSSFSRFGKGEFNYGVNRFITIGGGLEYLSSITNGPFIPFATTTIQPVSKLTLTGEYAYGVRTRGLLDYYFIKDALLEIDYTKYVEGQLATRFNALEERRVKVSVPYRYKNVLGFAKVDFTQLFYSTFNYNQTNVVFSVYYRKFSANSATQLNWINNSSYINSILALSYRPGRGYTILPTVQYDFSENRVMSCKLAIEKAIRKGNLVVSYERNFLINDNFINLNFRYDLSFARTNLSASHNRGIFYTSASAQGSLAFGSGNKYLYKSNNPSVSKGGISLYPFLDMNMNGVFDKGERMVKLTSVRIMGGKALFNEKDSIVRIPDLNAFTSYIIEFNNNDLENISWRFKNKVYQVLVDPNQFKRIDIPVITVGEVSGMAYRNIGNSLKGTGRILVKFYRKNNSEAVAETLSESDGFINYLGLEPGDYTARIDSSQMSGLEMTVTPKQIDFTIEKSFDGYTARGIDFILSEKTSTGGQSSDSLNSKISDKELIVTGISNPVINEILKALSENKEAGDSIVVFVDRITAGQKNLSTLVWGELCDTIGNYFIQCGAFRYFSNALRLAKYIKENTGLVVGIALQNTLYKVRVECVDSRTDAESLKKSLLKKNVPRDLFIVIRK